jgi:hypothetical protein
MGNPFNPLDWIKSAQDWFSKTEKSSGFRPYLIFLIVHVGFVITLLSCFPQSPVTLSFVSPSLYVSFGFFIVLFAVKAFQDPDFCRSEKHIETVKRIELQEQKGDLGPTPIDISSAEVPVANRLLPSGGEEG